MQKQILLTLDYELFFAKSGTPEKSILEPTDRLLRVLKELDICASFFVDTTYLNRLIKSSDSNDHIIYQKIKKQLQDIVECGSRLELHLHPHWIDAIKKDGRWIFPTYQHYKINSLSHSQIKTLFSDGVSLLHEIAREVDPSYNVAAFRAGGWCVEPFAIIKPFLRENNLYIDSSICPGLFLDGDIHGIDYRDVQDNSIYRFSNNVRVLDDEGDFWEIPVNGFKANSIERGIWLLKGRINKKESKIWGDGKGILSIKTPGRIGKILSLLRNEPFFSQFILDGYVDKKLLYRKINNTPLSVITIVAHPKTLTESSLSAICFLKSKGYIFSMLKRVIDENL